MNESFSKTENSGIQPIALSLIWIIKYMLEETLILLSIDITSSMLMLSEMLPLNN